MVKSILKERRTAQRTKRVLSIEYRLSKSNRPHADHAWHLSTTEDVSATGLSFYSDYEYRPDDTLDIRVVMSGILDIFKGKGKVVHVEQKYMGACFFVAVEFLKEAAASPRRRGRQSLRASSRREPIGRLD